MTEDELKAECERALDELGYKGGKECWPKEYQIVLRMTAVGLREAAAIARNGSFLHDESPDARLGKALSGALESKARERER